LAKVLHNFQLIICILGGLGEVKLCTHKITGEVRAVKFLRKENMTAKAKQWFENEINILKTLDHPNIVRLFEIYEDN
jgi:calcium-dependent protein kinase